MIKEYVPRNRFMRYFRVLYNFVFLKTLGKGGHFWSLLVINTNSLEYIPKQKNLRLENCLTSFFLIRSVGTYIV